MCALLTLLSISNVCALPDAIEHDLSPRGFNHAGNDLDAVCFTPETHPDVAFANLTDCRGALGKLVRQPGFLIRFKFSKNWRFGIKVPKQWQQGDCTIFVSCGNDYDTDTFRYADVARAAQSIMRTCIEDKPDEPYGGLESIGEIGSFYVAVGKPRAHPPVAIGSANRSEDATA